MSTSFLRRAAAATATVALATLAIVAGTGTASAATAKTSVPDHARTVAAYDYCVPYSQPYGPGINLNLRGGYHDCCDSGYYDYYGGYYGDGLLSGLLRGLL